MAGTLEKVPSLARLRRQYPTEAACRSLLETLRWPQGPFCPHCGSYAHSVHSMLVFGGNLQVMKSLLEMKRLG